jgi:two-component sensor histidine kinase
LNDGEQDQTADIQRLLRQQAVLAQFGELALKGESLDEILTQACLLVGQALGTDLAKVMELQADGQTLRVRAGVGWKPGVVGVAQVNLSERSSESHALRTGEPMTSSDINQETRFEYADFLKDNGVRAVVNVAILGSEEKAPFGVLQVDSREPREFTRTDILFLRGYANLLAAAVARLRGLDEMRRKEDELKQALEKCRHGAERQTFLSREVDHRAKNMLAVLQAALRLTKADDVPSFVQVLEGRVAALARAQSLLAADQWQGADLHTLLRDELAPYLGRNSGPQAELAGPALLLPAATVQPLSIALHEMGMNAIKYGALSRPTGRLRISWQVGDGSVVQIRWAESGGPLVEGPPDKRGFGSRVLTNTLRMQLGGTIFMAWEATGLVCDFTVPLVRTKPQ